MEEIPTEIFPGPTEPRREITEPAEEEIEISELRAQLTKIQLKLMSLQQKLTPEPRTIPLDPPNDHYSLFSHVGNIKDEKSPAIQHFYSNSGDFDRFFVKINGAFLLAPWKFASNTCCVVFTCQHLEGNAASWAEPILTREDLDLQSNWKKFFAAFYEQFQDPNLHDHLIRKLYSLKQTKSVYEYVFDFESLARKTGQSYVIWRNIFYCNLKDNIKDLLVEIPCKKSNYEHLKCAVLKVDEHWVFCYIESSTHKTIHPTFNQSTTIPIAHAPSHIPTAPQNPITWCPSPLSQDEKDHCCALHLYLYCGDSGHIAASCPAKVPHLSFNAVETSSTCFPAPPINDENLEKA